MIFLLSPDGLKKKFVIPVLLSGKIIKIDLNVKIQDAMDLKSSDANWTSSLRTDVSIPRIFSKKGTSIWGS